MHEDLILPRVPRTPPGLIPFMVEKEIYWLVEAESDATCSWIPICLLWPRPMTGHYLLPAVRNGLLKAQKIGALELSRYITWNIKMTLKLLLQQV